MDNKIIFVKNKLRKHGKKFSLFAFIGVLKAIVFILLSWLIIDILNVWALTGSAIVVVLVFLITYFLYRITNVIKPSFLKYIASTIAFDLMVVTAIWFLVDFIGFSGAFSSMIVVIAQFLLRYIFFNQIGLIKDE